MTTTPILVPASNLAKSPVNVRKRTDARADAELETSISNHGLIQNLVAVPVARKNGHYRVTAGGRRLDAIHRLIEKGTLSIDYEVPVLILSNAKDGREISLVENYDRLAMSPAEDCLAFRDLIEVEGRTPADIARRFGIEERFVLGRLRLANLSDRIFAALEAEEITLDIAKAYATTADTGRQTAVWEAVRGTWSRDNVNEIRRLLKNYSYRADDPKALLVGRDAYIAAGGRVEDADLFSTAADERWVDTHILDALADTKLLAEAQAIQEREGLGEVRVIADSRIPYTETYALRPLTGTPASLTQEQEVRKLAIEAQIAEIESDSDQEGHEPHGEDEQRQAALRAELATIVDRAPLYDAEQKASALAYVILAPDGRPQIHHQLYVAPADETVGEDMADGGEGDAHAQMQEGATDEDPKPMISQRLYDMMAMMKTRLLALHVASDPGFALDLGTFIMADEQRQFAGSGMPSDLRAPMPSPLIADFKPETPAAVEWARLDETLDRSWVGHSTIEERYDAFCALHEDARGAWLGWVIARTLRSVPAGADGSGFLDHLGRKLGIDVAAWWRPTALTFFDRLTKPGILALFEEVGGEELRLRYSGSKKHDLAASAERLFGGRVIMEPEVQKRALAWLPYAMRFDVAQREVEQYVPDAIRDHGAIEMATDAESDGEDSFAQAA
ncbi:MAG TPA: ParB/RepB/Spo0J family partition protein [Sphingobium sp.]